MVLDVLPSRSSPQLRYCTSGIAQPKARKEKFMMQSIEQEDFLDVSSPIEISDQVEVFDQGMHEQVAHYSTWLSGQAKRDPAASIHASQEYTERAAKIVQVGEQRIQTFAPFRYKYSALQTITAKQNITLIMLGLVVVLG